MIYHEPFPLKNISLWLLLFCTGLIIAYVILVSLISINVGLNHMLQDGFWVPILAGAFSIVGCVCLLFFFSRLIIKRMKEKDTINNI
ncbi:hypothetical protein ACFL7M_18440 [Thermodesulfobacteriota bacterium]